MEPRPIEHPVNPADSPENSRSDARPDSAWLVRLSGAFDALAQILMCANDLYEPRVARATAALPMGIAASTAVPPFFREIVRDRAVRGLAFGRGARSDGDTGR
jgi:hypothetical protein